MTAGLDILVGISCTWFHVCREGLSCVSQEVSIQDYKKSVAGLWLSFRVAVIHQFVPYWLSAWYCMGICVRIWIEAFTCFLSCVIWYNHLFYWLQKKKSLFVIARSLFSLSLSPNEVFPLTASVICASLFSPLYLS